MPDLPLLALFNTATRGIWTIQLSEEDLCTQSERGDPLAGGNYILILRGLWRLSKQKSSNMNAIDDS